MKKGKLTQPKNGFIIIFEFFSFKNSGFLARPAGQHSERGFGIRFKTLLETLDPDPYINGHRRGSAHPTFDKRVRYRYQLPTVFWQFIHHQ
jgi:hypothetical protein